RSGHCAFELDFRNADIQNALWSPCLACLEHRRKSGGAADCSLIPNDAQTKNVYRLVAAVSSFSDGRELLPKSRVLTEIRQSLDDPAYIGNIGIGHALSLHSR